MGSKTFGSFDYDVRLDINVDPNSKLCNLINNYLHLTLINSKKNVGWLLSSS